MTEAKQRGRHPKQTASQIILVLNIVGLLCFLYCTTIVLPKFRVIFDELLEGRALPTITRAILAIPALIYTLCILGAIVGLIWKESRTGDGRKTLSINVAAFIVGVLAFMVLIAALFLPLVSMHSGLSN